MVCKHCGSQLSIEDEKCPFCGQVNEAVQKHTREMRHFSGQFQEAKSGVLEHTGRLRRYVPLLVLIAVLAVGNILLIVMLEQSYQIENVLEEWRIAREESSYYNRLSDLETEGDYLTLGIIYTENYLYSNDRLREFAAVAEAGELYGKVQESIGVLAAYQAGRAGEEACDSALQSLGYNLKRLYEIFDGSAYRYIEEAMRDTHVNSLKEIREKVEAFLKAVCECTETDLEELEGLESQGISSLIRSKVVTSHED